MNIRKNALNILIVAVFLAAFVISLYYLALYPVIKDSERQQKVDEKYASVYNMVQQLFAPEINVYSYEEFKGMQKGESDGDMDNYLPLIKPVIMPDYELGMVIQPYEIQQFAEQADALRYGERVQYREPESYVGKTVQVFDFCLKSDRLTPYYERLKTSGRNDIPFVRLVVDYNSNVVLSASVIFRHRAAGSEEGSMYWAAGTPGEQILNTIVEIYDSRPELFVDYVAPEPEPTPETPASEEPTPETPASEEPSPSPELSASPATTE